MNGLICERCDGRGVDGRTERPCWYCSGSGAIRPGPRKTGRPS